MYKKILYIVFIFLSVLFGYFYFLYKTEKIIFLESYRKLNNANNTFVYEEKKINAIYFDEKDTNITIPLLITDTLFDVKNPELFFYDAFFQFFRYLNMYEVNTFFLSLNHIAINKKNLIINMHINKKKRLSIKQEINLLKSIYYTAKNILPYIENIYFYDENDLLQFNHVESYITQEMVKFNFFYDEPKKGIENNKNNRIIVPLFEDHGNKINTIFEKNIFQDSLYKIYFSKHTLYSKEWQKELNLLQNEEKKIIYFMNFFESNTTKISLYMYPFFEEDTMYAFFDSYERKITFNKEIFLEIKNIQEKLSKENYKVSIEIMPLRSILLTPENSIFILVSARNKEEIKTIFDMIMQK